MLSQYHILVISTVLLSVLFSISQAQNDDWIDCPLCADPTHYPQDPDARFVAGTSTITCQTAFEIGQNLTLPAENCTFWQSRGELICQCAAEPPERNDCTLCESGGSLPDPLRSAIPGTTCAEAQVDAKRDEPELCIVYQQTLGVYCGCDNSLAPLEVCRLCGGNVDLPHPLQTLFLLTDVNQTTPISCAELEFTANLAPGEECKEFQLLYQANCCESEETTTPPAPAAAAPKVVWLSIWIFAMALSCPLYF